MCARGGHFTGQCVLRLVGITACVEIPSSWGPDDVPCVDRHFAALSIQAWALSCCPHGAAVAQGAVFARLGVCCWGSLPFCVLPSSWK